MTASEFRVLGPELDEVDSYIDVVVDGIDGEQVTFSEKGGSRTWTVKNERISELRSDNLMLEANEVADHALWKRTNDVGNDRKQTEDKFAKGRLKSAQRELFRAAYEATR